MLKYVDVKEVFSEIPDEITLAISISGCPLHCKGCHSEYLWKDEGKELSWKSLNTLINIHTGITCVCFMGGDQDHKKINDLAYHIKHSTDLKVAWYSGINYFPKDINERYFDYIKYGSYQEDKGGLNSKTTNQVMMRKVYKESIGSTWENITYKFQKGLS